MSDNWVDSVVLHLNDVIRMDKVKTWATAKSERLFWIFAFTHMALWTIVPTLTSPNAPLDVIEGYAWGHEWLLGTHKHPPMQAWWLGALGYLTNRAHWAHFMASQIAILISFWAVWQTGRRMFTEQSALLGVLLLEGVVYYNFTSPEFNPNVLQLPFWALTGLYFYRAVKDNRSWDWFLLGVWGAAGLYSKYSSILLLATLALLLLVRPEGRRLLKQSGPYLAAATTVLLFLPHVAWLFEHEFLPFTYAWDRMHDTSQTAFIISYIRAPLFYILSQLLAIFPALLLFICFFDHGALPRDKHLRSFDKDFLDFMTFGPFVLTLVMAICVGIKIHDMWAMPFWNFIGLWAISRFKAVFSPQAVRRFTYSWVMVCMAGIIGYAGSTLLAPYAMHRAMRVQFPGQALTAQLDTAWHQHFEMPLQYVIGDAWVAGNVAYYTPEWPHLLIKGNYKISPWVMPANVRQSGALIVWCMQNCAYKNTQEAEPSFVKDFPQAEIQEPVILPRQTDADLEPAKIGWAILPPSEPTEH